MLHGSETWPVRKENVVALQRTEMRMVQGPRGRPKRTWREVVREDCQARKLNKKGCHGSLSMEEDDEGCAIIRMGVSG